VPSQPVTQSVENYIYTVEAVQACYERLAPGGLLVMTRWAQWPPSEDVRLGRLRHRLCGDQVWLT